jgi:hypothetical protein
MLAIDADSHFVEPLDLYEKYIDPQFRDRAFKVQTWFWFTWRGIFTASKRAGEGAGRNERMSAASNEAGNLWLALALNVASRIQWLEIALTVRNAAPIAGRRVHSRNPGKF